MTLLLYIIIQSNTKTAKDDENVIFSVKKIPRL